MNLSAALASLNPIYIHHPVAFILRQFLKKQGISVDLDFLNEKLNSHPYFPSLLSVSDVLNEMGIDHQALRADVQLLKDQIHGPAFIHLNSDQGAFAVVQSIKPNKFKLLTEQGDTIVYSEEDFIKKWNGVLLCLRNEQGQLIKHSEVYPSYLKYLLAVLSVLILTSVLKQFVPSFGYERSFRLAVSIAGVLISWILILQHFNKGNHLVKQLCDSSTEEGCASVLADKTASITPWLTMADAGLIYFAGLTTLNLFFEGQSVYLLLSLMAPVVSLYAVYLQAVVLEQWCRLCLLIHGLILIGFIETIHSFQSSAFDPATLGEQVLSFLAPGVLWLAAKPVLRKLKERSHYLAEYRRLKANPSLFQAFIKQQPKIHIPQGLKNWVLGAPDSKTEITLVSNPFCEPCAEAHHHIEEWLKQNLDVKINVIFMHSFEESDTRLDFVRRMSNVTDLGTLRGVLKDWFSGDEKQDLEKWSHKYGLRPTSLPYDESTINGWFKIAEIRGTPAIYINGHQVPAPYHLEDLRYLISEI